MNTLKSVLGRWLRAMFRQFVRTHADKGHLEVERKFIISIDEATTIPGRAATLGFKSVGTATMSDTFLPGAFSGEMMRVRRESLNGHTDNILTFKQWVAMPDGGKERKETERNVGGSIAALWIVLGRVIASDSLLGFRKKRVLLSGTHHGFQTVISVDDVTGLGRFSGTYLEVEVLVPLNENPSAARESIFELVTKLLGEPRQDLKQSYMDMLVQSNV